MPVDLNRLTAKQVQELSRDQTVFFFSVGPLEDHGPHLPVGLDLSEAETLSRMAAERLERERPGWIGVIMPSAPLGASSNTSVVAITVRGYVLRDWLVDACRSLKKLGFRHFVCFSGQLGPRQLTAIEDAGKMIAWKGPITKMVSNLFPPNSPMRVEATFASASSALVGPTDARLSPFWPDPLEHGAARDTGVALALGWMGGKQITSATANALGLQQKSRRGTPMSRGLELLMRRRAGYWGPQSPTNASEALGRHALHTNLDQIFPKLRLVWDGSSTASAFRSWYSIWPPNKVSFRAWILSLLIISMLIVWVYVSVQGFVSHE